MVNQNIDYIKRNIKKTLIYSIYNKIKRRLRREQEKELKKESIKGLLKTENPVIVEIGCNDGKDSREFLNTFKDIKLYCFEPDPRFIEIFKKNIKDKRCLLYEQAISDKEGEDYFYISESKDPSMKGEDSSSIKRPKDHLKKFPWIKFEKKIKIRTTTLDKWINKNKIKKIDFIWADVQGAEKELILGGKNTLKTKVRYFYTEFYNQELYEGQINLKEILKMLPDFRVLNIFGNNVLLKNINLK